MKKISSKTFNKNKKTTKLKRKKSTQRSTPLKKWELKMIKISRELIKNSRRQNTDYKKKSSLSMTTRTIKDKNEEIAHSSILFKQT